MAASASGFVNNWQAGKSLAECNLRMFQEEDSCDVTFRCGPEGHVVKAHRYMLISRSCVFHAMLTGAMGEKSDVKIPDIEPLVFKTFLKYIYTDDIYINADNVTALLYTARKYGVISLETLCTAFLEKNLIPQNSCIILEAAHRFDQKLLYDKALTLIKSQGERSLQSPGFLALSQVLVDEIVGSDYLEADEHVIFTAVNDWSEAECEREGREVTPESKRAVLGGTLMKVRFPLMKQTFLADTVKESGLLTDTERVLCFDFAAVPNKSVTPFNQNQRFRSSLIVSKKRFLSTKGSWMVVGKVDAICFSSSSNLLLHGCQLYGTYNSNEKNDFYVSAVWTKWRHISCNHVTSYFGDEDNVMSCVVQERSEYTSEGEVFDVIFSCPVSVSAGEWYTLAVKMEGPNTCRGEGGQEKVVCDDGVELQFRSSRHCKNVTTTRVGQIPSLIYRKV